ncbi:MAG: SBBP repeat-containing protein [Ignavibacteriales bacterium]|nr:SBBP repeat-containing protein [Ignavibacteriales bacterium]
MKAILIIIFSITIIFSISLKAQNIDLKWLDIYEGNNINGYPEVEIQDMLRSSAGDIYVTGYQRNEINISLDYVTIKYNSDGERQWIKTFDGPIGGGDVPSAIALDNFGNLYIAGYADWSGGFNNRDITVIKYSNNGDELWVRNFDGPGGSSDFVSDIELDNSNNILITGSSNSISSTDFVTLKYNSSGDFLWSKFYNGTGNAGDNAYEIELDNDDNIYITGSSFGVGTGRDIVTIKYNPNGDEVWIKRYNNDLANDGDSPSDMALDTFGNIYVTGSSEDVSNNDDYVTIKYNSNGDEVWVRRYNGTGNDYDGANAILIDRSGDIIITGESEGTSESNIVTIKYDTDGNEQWIKRFNASAAGNFIKSDNAGNIYVCGPGSQSQGENTKALIIKYNPSGEVEWYSYWSDQGSSTLPQGFLRDNRGNIYVAGSIFRVSPTDYDIFTAKFSEVIQTPPAFSKVMAGDSLTIQFGVPYWGGDSDISYVSNEGTQYETSNIIASNIPLGTTEYNWHVPADLLSYRTKIIVSNSFSPLQYIESDIFRVKPYIITKLDDTESFYIPYDITRDRWSFTNNRDSLWSQNWWQQFDYQNGLDPFTNSPYLNTQFDQGYLIVAFAGAKSSDFPRLGFFS